MKKPEYICKETPWGTLYPSLENDTADGKPIKKGCLFMRQHGGTAFVKHEGQKREIEFSSDLGGSTILIANGRAFRLNLEAFIDHAIAHGILDATIDFKA